MPDQIRVLRVIEYVGDRAAVENHLKSVLYSEKVVHGEHGTYTIKAATVGVVPEIYKP
jgi:hypothetical protein